MGVVGPGSYWDGVVNGGVAGDEEFESMLSILDFPMESLEGDEFVEDWDATNSHCLGPISLDMLMTQPVIPREKIDTQSQHVLAETNIDAIDENSLQKQQPHYVEEASSSHVSPRKKFTGVHQTLSPVSVLESCRSSTRKSLLIKSSIKVPVRTRSKRVRPSGKNPWCLLSPLCATTSPTKRTSSFLKNEEGRRTSSQLSDATQSTEVHLNCQAAATRKCSHCGITQTPQWREGPMGRRTLCNACGVRYRSGRLFPEYRPAASPTFVPSLHSNSHRKVIEMRYKAKCMQVKVKKPKDPAAGSGCHE